MKLVRIKGENFEFELRSWEQDQLHYVLQLYPLVPEAHHRLSKGSQIPHQAENQQLLDEALKAQRMANQKLVLAMLNEPGRFAECATGVLVSFTRGELEWLLQVLNDVRVGSWIALGSPGYSEKAEAVQDEQSMIRVMIMEIAGGFEGYFLGAVSGDWPPEED